MTTRESLGGWSQPPDRTGMLGDSESDYIGRSSAMQVRGSGNQPGNWVTENEE